MSKGIDMSKLFSNIMIYTYTQNLENKKIIYQYLLKYAVINEEAALMTINAFIKDCNSEDYRI